MHWLIYVLQNMVMLHIILRERNINNMQANNLDLPIPSTPGVGSKRRKIFFSESAHVATNIWNEEFSNIQGKLLPLHTP